MMTFKKKLSLASAITLALLIPQAPGGTPPELEKSAEGGRPPLIDLKIESSYTFEGETEFRGSKYGESDAFNVNLSASILMPLNERWFIPFEVQSQNFSLGSLAGVPLPDTINMLEIGTGLAYRPNDTWMYMVRVNSALYKFEDIGSNDIGISGGLMIAWDYSPALKFMFGAMWQPDNDLPVLPLVGLHWLISEQWELQLAFPQPRLIYSPTEKWRIYAGMDLLLGTTFRTEDTLGTSIDQPRFNDELGSYSDIRASLGIGYKLTSTISIEAEGGYSLSREVDYPDLDEKVELDSAPYFRIGLRYEF